MPVITVSIIVLTVGISFMAFNNEELFSKLKYNPYLVHRNKAWYRVVSHALVHGDYMHLGVNMYVFFIFGRRLEYIFEAIMGPTGMMLYLILYIGGVLFAALPGYRKHKENHSYSSVGASGAVASILFAGIILEPMSGIGIIFIPGIYIPAFIFGILYLWYEYYMDKKSQDNIAHDAHFWGALFGVVFTILVVPNAFTNFVMQVTEFNF